MLSIAYVLFALRILTLKTEGQNIQTEQLKSYKNEIEILANRPRLA